MPPLRHPNLKENFLSNMTEPVLEPSALMSELLKVNQDMRELEERWAMDDPDDDAVRYLRQNAPKVVLQLKILRMVLEKFSMAAAQLKLEPEFINLWNKAEIDTGVILNKFFN